MKQFTTLLVVLSTLFVISCGEESSDSSLIARVNDHEIDMDELKALGKIALSKSGVKFDSEEGQERFKEIAPNLFNTVIDIYVMKDAAREEGIEPSEEELETEFVKMKEHLKNQGAYERFLQNMGFDEESFRKSIRDHLALKILQSEKFFSTDYEPTEQEIEDYYYKNLAHYRYPNRFRFSHIFIEAGKDESTAARRTAKEKAMNIREQIGENPEETFADLARRYSEDPYTASDGGDFGFVLRQDPKIQKEFLDAAADLQEGEVSDVIETDLGYHIVWMTDREQSLEEAKEEVQEVLINDKRKEQFQQWLEQKREKMEIEHFFDPHSFTFSDQES